FQDIRARQADGLTAEDLTALEAIADGVEAVRGETTRRETARAEQQAAADAIAARIDPPAPAGDEGQAAEGGEGGEGEPAAAAGDEGQAAEGGEGGEGAQVPEAVAAAATPAPAPVPAARPRVNLSQIRRQAPQATPPRPQSAALLAAANVPGLNAGSEIDIEALAAAAISRFGTMPTPNQNYEGRIQHGLALIRKDVPDELVADGANDDEVLALAADERRLQGGSLVAAGGWCAPPETWYD